MEVVQVVHLTVAFGRSRLQGVEADGALARLGGDRHSDFGETVMESPLGVAPQRLDGLRAPLHRVSDLAFQ